MAVCDICGAPGRGTTIGAKDMKAAVTKKGFNPLKKGLIKDPAAVAGGDMWYGGWKNMVIQDSSDWNICDGCMAQLQPYLVGQPQVSGVTQSSARQNGMVAAIAEAASGDSAQKPQEKMTRRWWQFWK